MIYAVIVISVILPVLLISYITYRIAFFSSPKSRGDIMEPPPGEQYIKEGDRMGELIRELRAIPYEQVCVTSRDGLRLTGKYYHVDDNAPLQIQFHGYRGSGIRDFCGGNKLARDMGHNTLLVTQRAHGDSQGKTISFGINERHDCLCWISYACERFGENKEIILSGVSMGAVTVLMASGLELPDNVKCIIADSPYSSASGIIRKVCRDMKISPNIAFPFIRLGARIFGGIKLSDGDVRESVSRAKKPILIIHGESDDFVPCDMSREIHGACQGKIVRETFPGAGHGMSYITDEPRYRETVENFLRDALI